jgi:hypothetical protein
MSPEFWAFFDLIFALGIIGTVIGIVLGIVAGFIKVGFHLAPYLVAGGLIMLLIEFLK